MRKRKYKMELRDFTNISRKITIQPRNYLSYRNGNRMLILEMRGSKTKKNLVTQFSLKKVFSETSFLDIKP